MKCKLCNKFFVTKNTFNNLFSVTEICEECKKTFKPKLNYEVFPIQNGLIEYYYLYENILANKVQLIYLAKHYDILFEIIRKKENISIILDDYIFQKFPTFLKYIKPFHKITLISLIKYNFEKLEDFL